MPGLGAYSVYVDTTDMMLRDSDLTDRDRQRIWAAQLADMPLAAIVAWLDSQGWVLRPKRTHGGAVSQPIGTITMSTTSIIADMGTHLCPNGNKERPYPTFLCSLCMGRGIDALPPGYPPLADEDLPFDAERDRL